MRLLITTMTTALLISSAAAAAAGEEVGLKRVLAQDGSPSHNTVMQAAVQDQITDTLGDDKMAGSTGGLSAITGFLKKRFSIDKKRVMMYDCMNTDNQVEPVLFSGANKALIHACFAIGQIKNSTNDVAIPIELTVAKFDAPPPYYAWNIENKSPKHKRKGSKKTKNKREEAEENVQSKFVIASKDCQMLGVVTKDAKNGILYPCEKQWHVEL